MECVVKLGRLAFLYHRIRRIYMRIKDDPSRFNYMDVALTPVTEHDVEDLEMFHTPSAPAFVEQEQRREATNAAAREHAHSHAA